MKLFAVSEMIFKGHSLDNVILLKIARSSIRDRKSMLNLFSDKIAEMIYLKVDQGYCR